MFDHTIIHEVTTPSIATLAFRSLAEHSHLSFAETTTTITANRHRRERILFLTTTPNTEAMAEVEVCFYSIPILRTFYQPLTFHTAQFDPTLKKKKKKSKKSKVEKEGGDDDGAEGAAAVEAEEPTAAEEVRPSP